MVVSKPILPHLANLKWKRVHSSSLMRGTRKAKKRKGLSLPSDLVLSPSKMHVIETMVEVEHPPDLRVATLTSVSKSLEGKEEEPVTIEETRVMANNDLASVMDFLMWVTWSTMKARATITKVKWPTTPMIDMGKDGEVWLFVA